MPSLDAGSFVALVPVKPPAVGKSRLGDLPDVRRRDLAGAFALDTVTAVVATPEVGQVLVVTDDALFSRDLVALGCASMPDGAHDLNASLQQAAAEARRRWPDLRPVAICADLPALRADDLQAALRVARGAGAWFVADGDGTGTTAYAAPYDDFAPRFGIRSRAAHLGAGTCEVTGELPSLRCDVDDVADLRRALALGVGPHTAAVAEHLGPLGPDAASG